MNESTPTRYVLHLTTTRCANCGSSQCASDFFALSFIRPRFSTGAPVRHLEPCGSPQYNLPIDYTASTPRVTAFCARCPRIDLSHLPPPPSTARLTDLAEPVLHTQRASVTAKSPSHSPPTAKRPSIDELA